MSESNAIGRLILGTANFGMSYGVTNPRGEISFGEITRILEECKVAGVREVDTAQAYGRAEEKLGLAGLADFRVTTKIRLISGEGAKAVGQKARESLARLKGAKISTILLHNEERLAEEDGREVVKALRQLQAEQCVGRIGLSSYDPRRALDWCEEFRLDVVQLPANALDNRLFEDHLLSRFLANGTEVQARSVFLQGILLENPVHEGKVPEVVLKAARQFREKCRVGGLSPLEGALGHVMRASEKIKIILGISSLEELRQILGALPVTRAMAEPFSPAWRNEFDPRNWPA